MKKTFLLGLGAQKAGTTWIYRYLHEHPECELGNIKEQAVFPAYFKVGDAQKRTLGKVRKLQEELTKFQRRVSQGKQNPAADRNLLDRMDNLAAEKDLGYYVAYANRLVRQNPDAKLIGDITPVYSSLNAEQLSEIKQLLEGAGFDVKVVFLMRDPVERCYSAVRMGHRRDKAGGKSAGKAGPHAHFARNATSDWCNARTRYETIVPDIEKVFAPKNVFLGLYETFFSTEKIQGLCKFLNLSYIDADVDKKVNTSPREEEPSPEQLAEVRKFYDATYRFMAEREGEDVIAAAWPHYNRSF